MREITVSAKTLDDAITEALIELEITSDMLEYDVVEKGSVGFLGIGMKQAVITARKKQPVKEVTKETVVSKVEEPKVEYKKAKQEVTEKAPTKKEPIKKEIVKKEPVKEESTKIKNTERVISATESKTYKETELVKVEEKTKNACETFLKEVLNAMGMEVSISSSIDSEGALYFDMSGKNMGLLIGKRGQTLDSLQYLVNRIANKNQDGYVRVKLDTENYRNRRKETLESLAKNIAFKVKRSRKSESLEPMNPYERRIIHSALQADKTISTYSEGEEPYRKVVITLARK